jgi:hypothetical protein
MELRAVDLRGGRAASAVHHLKRVIKAARVPNLQKTKSPRKKKRPDHPFG